MAALHTDQEKSIFITLCLPVCVYLFIFSMTFVKQNQSPMVTRNFMVQFIFGKFQRHIVFLNKVSNLHSLDQLHGMLLLNSLIQCFLVNHKLVRSKNVINLNKDLCKIISLLINSPAIRFLKLFTISYALTKGFHLTDLGF